MLRNYRIGTILGFPIYVHVSFVLLLAVAIVWLGGLEGILLVGIAFSSVVAHELGHAVVARRLGVPVDSIELQFFGGTAKMRGTPKSATHEIAIAAAGPIVSFVVGGTALLFGAVFGIKLITLVGWINLVIGVFNLTPALPMDGGRIVRALLTWKYDYLRATELAVKITKVVAITAGIWALASFHFYIVLLSIVLWSMANRELNAARHLSAHFSSGPGGYRQWPGDVEVLPRQYSIPQSHPRGFGFRRENGRIIIEFTD